MLKASNASISYLVSALFCQQFWVLSKTFGLEW